jgi:hypothetical protein
MKGAPDDFRTDELAHEVDLIADALMGAVHALEGWADEVEAGGDQEDPEHSYE